MEYTQVGAWALDPWVETTLKELGLSSVGQVAKRLNTQYDMLLSDKAIAKSCRRLENADKVVGVRTRMGVKYNLADAPPPPPIAERIEPILHEILLEEPWIYVAKLAQLLSERGVDVSPSQVGAALNTYTWAMKTRTNVGMIVSTINMPYSSKIVRRTTTTTPSKPPVVTDPQNDQWLELAVMDIVENGRVTPTELLNKLIAEGFTDLNPTTLGLILKSYDWLAKKRNNRGYILYAR